MIFSASAISTIKKVSLTTAGIASLLALSTASAHAASFTFDSSNNRFSPGNTFTLPGTFSASDTLDLTVVGTVNTLGGQSTDQYTTNAAGIVTVPTATGRNIGTAAARGTGSFSSGALLIKGNTLGFRQLFASNTANGLGNDLNPPTNLATGSVTLASIFGAFTGDTSLSFSIEPNFDFSTFATTSGIIPNGGSQATVGGFIVNGTVGQASATDVPEPFTIVGTLIGGTAALRMRKKLKAATN